MEDDSSADGVSGYQDDEIVRAVSLFQKLPVDEFSSPKCRELRKALRPFFAAMADREAVGATARTEHALRREARRAAAGQAAQRKALDKKYAANTILQAERAARLAELQKTAGTITGSKVPLICDGPALSTLPKNGSMAAICPSAELLAGQETSGGDDVGTEETGNELSTPVVLSEPRQCYSCKTYFSQLHHFYFLLCPTCAALNWEKREQTADLTGKTVLLTGGRVKIGYHVSILAPPELPLLLQLLLKKEKRSVLLSVLTTKYFRSLTWCPSSICL